MKLIVLLLTICVVFARVEESEEEQDEDKPESDEKEDAYLKYLYKWMKHDSESTSGSKKQGRVVPHPFSIPGPFEPLPGRSHNADYWPIFPFANQYSGGIDLDPSHSRHIGGDINIPVPSWGMLDISGRYFNRISDTTTKFGYISHPVNMLGLTKDDFVRLMSDPALQHNRNIQPLLPLGKVPKSNAPISCRPPMCNPYTQTFALGIEHDIGGHDGVDGDLNVPIPIGKDLAYRFPIGGNVYYDLDNITVTYGHNLSPVDPYQNPLMFNSPGFYKYFDENDRLAEAVNTRKTRSVPESELQYSPYLNPQYPNPLHVYRVPTAEYFISRASIPHSVYQNLQYAYPTVVQRPQFTPFMLAPPIQTYRKRFKHRKPTAILIQVLLRPKPPSRSTKVTSLDFNHPLKRTKRFYSIFDQSRRHHTVV